MTPPLIYTWASITAIVVAVVTDLWVLRTRLLTTRLFWASYAIVLFFQFIVNGILTGLGIVQYAPSGILGVRVFFAPVEDIGFGFGLVTLTLVLWTRYGRYRRGGPVEPARAGRGR